MSKGIIETISGAAIIAADFAFLGGNPLLLKVGASILIAGIGSLLTKRPPGSGTSVRNPIGSWNAQYGRGKQGGTTLYIESTGETDKFLHFVLVLACHPCQSIDALLFNQQRVCLDVNGNSLSFKDSTAVIASQQTVNILHISRTNDVVTVILEKPIPLPASTAAGPAVMDGDFLTIRDISGDFTLNGTYAITVLSPTSFSYISGGNPAIVDNEGTVITTWPDYGDTVHMETLLGDHTTTFPGLLADSNGLWTANHLLLGRTSVYLRLKFGGNTYKSTGVPTFAFILHGKNDIYDPRFGTHGYTENSALCVADYLHQQTWGYKAAYGTEIPNGALASAANICDETVPLASGGFEPRYTCNGGFSLTTKRGEVLQNLLTSCGGRLTYINGEFHIFPAAWIGPSATFDAGVPMNAAGSPVTSGTLTVWASFTAAGEGTPTIAAFAGVPSDHGVLGLSGPSISSIAQNNFSGVDLTGISGTRAAFTVALDPFSEVPLLPVLNIGCFIQGTLGGTGQVATFLIYDCYVDLVYADATTARIRGTVASYGNTTDPTAGLVTDEANSIDAEANPPATFSTITRSNFNSLASAGFLLINGFAFPGSANISPTSVGLNDLVGPFQWKPTLSIRDLYNGVKGIYVSPANHWQSSDIPPYAQDEDHGYHSGSPLYPLGDANLAADGGDRRWLDIQLPFTISSPCAQRLCKIELKRRRQQGSGTFSFHMAAYRLTALDVVSFTLAPLSWSAKLLEITSFRFTVNKLQNGANVLGTELDLHETDPSVYEWSPSEELSPQGFQQAALPDMTKVTAPAGVTGVSDSTTASVGADGISTSTILVSWTAPTDAFILNGGKTVVQYQLATSPLSSNWIAVGNFDPTTTSAVIPGVSDGQSYYVRVAFVNVAGAQSDWTVIGPITAGGGSFNPHFIYNETPVGAMDGVNQTYTLLHPPNPPNALTLVANGIDQLQGVSYTLEGNVITFLVIDPNAIPTVPIVWLESDGDWLLASYPW